MPWNNGRPLEVSSGDLDSLRARAENVRENTSSDWQPIETAPQDGTWVLLGWFELPGMSGRDVGFWHSTKRAWCDTHHVLHNPQSPPTHWARLLDPPQIDV